MQPSEAPRGDTLWYNQKDFIAERMTFVDQHKTQPHQPQEQTAHPEHGHTAHTHVHDPQEKKRQIARISRMIGHLEYIKKMIEADEDCSQVLIQLSAVRSAMNGLGREIINEHLSHCIHHAIEDGDTEAVEEFEKAIQRYLK